MGQTQWFQPIVRNRLNNAIVLTNFSIQCGQFYDIEYPYNETDSAQGTQIDSKAEHEFSHCGRNDSPSGTKGSFEVRLKGSDEKIADIYWDCPFIGDNKLSKSNVKDRYDISFNDFGIPSGALGNGKINVHED